MPSRHVIEDFLAQRHVALVGMSRQPKDFSRAVADKLREGGRTIYPVNPAIDPAEAATDGEAWYRALADVPDPLDGVLVMVPAAASAAVVQDAIDRGVTRVWLHRGAGQGAVSDDAVALCQEAGIAVVDGACPMMFDEPVRNVHRWHRWLSRRRFAA